MIVPRDPGSFPDGLEGIFFHTFTHDEASDRHLISRQGRIISKVGQSTYLVTFYSWLDGGESSTRLVMLEEMTADKWRFYSTQDQWERCADTHLATLERHGGK